ncbi:phage tail fiber protein [Mycobacterium marinum]|uniref:phage tail fiber protein n=1 Tax=Mycobacterium marinum TaxID=1781 RepID=UPI000B97BB61|nr:hypothetical protein [Mycobacterium marinum]
MTTGLHVDNANSLLNVFRAVSYSISSIYVQLHDEDPGADGEDNISAGDDSLKAVNFSAAAGGALALSTSPIWTNGGTSETLRYITVWDGPDGPGVDACLWAAQLTTPQSWADTDTYTLDSMGLAFTPIMDDPGS